MPSRARWQEPQVLRWRRPSQPPHRRHLPTLRGREPRRRRNSSPVEGTLAKDADLLSTILTYHVVPGQMTPDEIAGKTLTTVQGDDLEITGEGDNLKSQDASVICGGVQTANATVYLIDAVMMPPSV